MAISAWLSWTDFCGEWSVESVGTPPGHALSMVLLYSMCSQLLALLGVVCCASSMFQACCLHRRCSVHKRACKALCIIDYWDTVAPLQRVVVVQALHVKPQPASDYTTWKCQPCGTELSIWVLQRWRGAHRHSGRQHSAAARLRSSWPRLAKLRLMPMRGTFNWSTPSPNRSVITPPPAWVFASTRPTGL